MADTIATSSNTESSPPSFPITSAAATETRERSRDPADSGRPGKRPRLNPPSMTAAAAHADAALQKSKKTPPSTQTSPNPASQAVATLKGSLQNDMSKAETSQSSANPATTLSGPMAVVTGNLQQPAGEDASAESHTQTSPVSLSSLGTLDSMAGPSGMTTTVGSPLPIEETARQASATGVGTSTSPEDENKAMSFPPAHLTPSPFEKERRGMSLPHSGIRQGTRSPSSKKHKCPYCNTEFTRHHNLKSHLLTHSQEKPYVCSTCQSRFRRLHDLKRHTKLHTGERNHTCPKCGRKFARGDALARHNKGPGGCAGRRASMGSFGGDDDYDDGENMEGVMYGEPESIDDEEGNDRRPGIRRQAPSGDDTLDPNDHASRMPSTYPPIQGRPPGGIASGHFPPRGGFGPPLASGPSGTSHQGSTMAYQQMGSGSSKYPGTAFAQNPLSESPGPISPGQTHRGSASIDTRNRSPSMNYPSQPSSFGRSATGGSGSSLGIPGPVNQLPPPTGYLPSQAGPTHPPTGPTGPPTHVGSGPLSSHSNSLSSHGQQSAPASGDNSGSMFPKDDRIWAYVKSLETRLSATEQEVASLKNQLAAAQGQRTV